LLRVLLQKAKASAAKTDVMSTLSRQYYVYFIYIRNRYLYNLNIFKHLKIIFLKVSILYNVKNK